MLRAQKHKLANDRGIRHPASDIRLDKIHSLWCVATGKDEDVAVPDWAPSPIDRDLQFSNRNVRMPFVGPLVRPFRESDFVGSAAGPWLERCASFPFANEKRGLWNTDRSREDKPNLTSSIVEGKLTWKLK